MMHQKIVYLLFMAISITLVEFFIHIKEINLTSQPFIRQSTTPLPSLAPTNKTRKRQRVIASENLINAINQIAMSARLMRNPEHRLGLLTILQNLQMTYENDPMKDDIDFTIVINCHEECVFEKLLDVMSSIGKSKYFNQTILVAISKIKWKEDSLKLKAMGKFLPRLKIIEVDGSKNFVQTYKVILEHVKTKGVFMSRSITWFPVSANLEILYGLISHHKYHVVGFPYFGGNLSSWRVGCMKSKILLNQCTIVNGYDRILNGGFAVCDYITGPFMIDKDVLKNYITANQGMVKKINIHLHYLDLFHFLKTNDKKVQISFHVSFGQQHIGNEFEQLDNLQMRPFAYKNRISRITLPSGKEFRYTCEDVNINAKALLGKAGFFVPRCTIDSLDSLLLYITRVSAKNRFKYEIDSGSIVGQVKMSGTLPWERDHDFAYQSKYFIPLSQMRPQFARDGVKIGGTVATLGKCLEKVGTRNCGFLGIGNKHWYMEMWGQNLLSGDIYKDDLYHYVSHEPTLVNLTHVRGNRTYGQINNDWIMTVPNPGNYARSKYGLDILRHQQHWLDIGHSDSWKPYIVGKWRKCPKPGHQCCSDNFLADGNLIFKNVWA